MGWTGKVNQPRATGGRFHGATYPRGCTTARRLTVLEQGTLEMWLLVPPCTGYVTLGKSLHPWGPDFSSG